MERYQQQQHQQKQRSQYKKEELLIQRLKSLVSNDHYYNWLERMLLNKISIDNANIICDYVSAMRSEANISPITCRNLISNLCLFVRKINKLFAKITHTDISLYLDSLRKSEEDDKTQKWVGTYNFILPTIQKFFKWLYFPNTKSDNRALPECVSGFKRIKRKELARYSPSELWTLQEHNIFLKYCPSNRIRAYHAMALDTSARPHELFKLKIKDLKERLYPHSKIKMEI
jgi:site-specific recombinase XerD